MSMCRVFSCVVGRGCLLWPVRSLGKTLLAFAQKASSYHEIPRKMEWKLPFIPTPAHQSSFVFYHILLQTALWLSWANCGHPGSACFLLCHRPLNLLLLISWTFFSSSLSDYESLHLTNFWLSFFKSQMSLPPGNLPQPLKSEVGAPSVWSKNALLLPYQRLYQVEL